MRRFVLSLLVLGAAIIGLTWACTTSPSFTSSKLIGPSPITVGSQATYKLTAIRTGGTAEDDTANATWDVSPASVARVVRPGVVTGLSEGLATVTATLGTTVATMPLRVLLPGDYQVSGTVRDSSGNPILGAAVTAIGQGVPTTTDANGAYTLSNISGLTTIRASVISFTSDRQLNVNANTTGVDFTLQLPAGFVNLTGTWTTTLTLPSACASQFPSTAQQRNYSVTIKQSTSSLNFTFNSTTLVFAPTFSGTLNASGLTLPLITAAYYYYYYYSEPLLATLTDRIDLGQWLNVRGQIHASPVTASSFTGTLIGEFDYYTGDPTLREPPPRATPKVRCSGSTSVTFTQTSSTTALRSRR